MRILDAITSTPEGFKILKEDSYAMKAIVPILQAHPHDKNISDTASKILTRVSNIEDVESALKAVKNGDTSQVALLSSLLLVEDSLGFVIEKGGIKDLINLMLKKDDVKVEDRDELIKSCAIALSRISAAEDKYIHEIIQNNGLEAITGCLSNRNPEVLIALMDLVKKLIISEETAKRMIDIGIIKSIQGWSSEYKANEKLNESWIGLFSAISKFPNIKDFLLENDIVSFLLEIIKMFIDNKKIQEHVLKLLIALENEKNSVLIAKSDIVFHLENLSKNHSEWIKCLFLGLTLVEIISRNSEATSIMNKDKILTIIVDILTRNVQSQENVGEELEQTQSSSTTNQEILSVHQEKELR